MKKIILILSITAIAVLLSGCTTKQVASVVDGGVFRSTDFGEQWTQKSTLSQATAQGVKSISNLDVNYMVFDPTNTATAYFISKASGVYKTENRGDTWQPTTLATGTYPSFSIDPRNSNVIYTIQSNRIIKSVDGMKTWRTIYIETRPGQALISVVVDPFRFGVVDIATTSSLLKSTDYGDTWKLLGWEKIAIANLYASTLNPNVLYLNTKAAVYKSINGGNDWTKVSDGLAQFNKKLAYVWFSFDPHTETIVLGTVLGIFRSADGGSSWLRIPTIFDAKQIPLKSVVANPANPNEIIFSINNVLHKTVDGGQTWKVFRSVPTSRIITYLIADPQQTGTLYLGTLKPVSNK